MHHMATHDVRAHGATGIEMSAGGTIFFAELYGEVWLSGNGLTEIERDLTSMKDCGYKPDKRCFLIRRENRYRQLSNCNRISVFSSEFPDIPRKISAYLRADFTSDANTRKIRGFYIVLIISDLCLRGVSSHCKKHHFGLRNGLFQGAKWCFSATEIGFIGPWNGQYQKAKWVITDYYIGYIRRRYTPKQTL